MRDLRKNNLDIFMLGMGAMRMPVVSGNNGAIEEAAAQAIIDRCMAGGVNYFDTAYIYHDSQSESFLGRALARYPRESFYVADKYNLPANPDFKEQFAQQLERLQMDYIDFYLLHGISVRTQEGYLTNGCIEYFHQQKEQGIIRNLGFSFHGTPEELPQILERYPWDFVQIQFNYYDWYLEDAKALYEILDKAEIPVIVMEPVHGGLLARLNDESAAVLKAAAPDRSLASWAMRWVMGFPWVQVVLSGMSDLSQVEDNLQVFAEKMPLSESQQELVKKAATILHDSVTVACTSCRYCCPDCPAELNIPMLLEVYNDVKINGPWNLRPIKNLPEEKQPTACINCEACVGHCPQDFNIPGYMDEMKAMLKE